MDNSLISAVKRASIIRLILALFILLPLAPIYAAEINFQSVLQQERAWAGLSTKKVKSEEIEWVYSEGGIHQIRRLCFFMASQVPVTTGTV